MEINKIFSGYNPCQLMKNHHHRTDGGDRDVSETTVIFNQLIRLVAREDYIMIVAVKALDRTFNMVTS
jgi:hypothetical protein